MTKRKSTKRALLLSALSLLMCVSMLVGSTFAWFTDSVTSGVNKIVAGNLDIELEYAKVVDGQLQNWQSVKGATEIFDPNALWEPGRVEVVYLKVTNLGTLQLKYQLGVNVSKETPGVNVAGEEFKLSDHLVFKTVEMPDALTTYTDREATALAAGTEKGLKDYNGKTTALEAKNAEGTSNFEDYVALIVYMPETVGNEANYRGEAIPTIELGINLYATQYDAEIDSFGPDYDEDAWHNAMKVATADELSKAIANAKDGDVIVFADNIASVDGTVITDKKITIDLNGNTFAVSEGASTNNRNFKIDGASVVTIQNGTMVASGDTNSGAYGTIRTEGTANVTLENMKLYNYRGNGLNVKACAGTTVTINNTEIYSQYGGGVEAAGGIVELNNVKIEQKGLWDAPYNSMAVSVNGGGTATINGGTYTTTCLTAEEAYNQGTSHGPWAVGVLNSGGTLIINDGTFSNDNFGENSLAHAARGLVLADTGAVVKINGGTFNALKAIVDIQNNLGDASKNPSVTLAGGTFSADPTASTYSYLIKIADGYQVIENHSVYYVVSDDIDSVVSTAADLATAITNGGTISVVADIDMANSWTSVKPTREMTILGNGNTITNLNLPLLAGNVSTKATIKGLTVADSTIAPAAFENGLGSAAFIPFVDAYGNVTLEDCHLKNANVSSNCRAGGLVGYSSGQSLTIKNCSVEGCNITGVDGAAGLVAYSQSATTIENSSVKGSVLTATEDRKGTKAPVAGAVIGTVNANTSLTSVTVSGNTVSNNNATPVFNDCIGRWVAGELTIDNYPVVRNNDALKVAIDSGAKEILLPSGEYELDKAVVGVTIKGVDEKTTLLNAQVPIYGFTGKIYQRMHFENLTFTNTISTMQDTATEETGGGSSTFTNVTFAAGFRHGYGSSVVFTNCTFGSNSEKYALHFEGDSAGTAGEIKLTGCKFEGGKVHLGGPRTYAFTNCEFAAGSDFQVWSGVTLNGCTVGGVEVTEANVATLFPNLDLNQVTIK